MFGLYSRAAFSGKLGNNKVTAEIEKILSKGKVSKISMENIIQKGNILILNSIRW